MLQFYGGRKRMHWAAVEGARGVVMEVNGIGVLSVDARTCSIRYRQGYEAKQGRMGHL